LPPFSNWLVSAEALIHLVTGELCMSRKQTCSTMGTPWVQLRTKEQIARAIRKEGGVIEVYLKLDDVGSHNFGRIRERCCEGGDARGFKPLSYISLFRRFPASGRPPHRVTISKFSHPQTPFEIEAAYPFIANRTKGMLHVQVAAPVQNTLCQDLAVAFKGIHTVELAKPSPPPVPRPKFLIRCRLSDEEVHKKLQFAKENFERGPRTATAVGLSLKFWPDRSPHLTKFPPISEGPYACEYEDFPFLGKT
jgi:hypothetical protein